jgi:hypothetical protein
MKKTFVLAAFCLVATWAAAEDQLQSDFRREFSALGDTCFHASFKDFTGCAQTLVMGKPLHVAFGSIAPQNGVAAGLAFFHETNVGENWSLKFNSDAVASTDQSWRAGFYVKAIPKGWQWTGDKKAVFNFYSQGIVLNKILYFGPGPSSILLNQSLYGMEQSISGASAIIPTPSPFSFYGEWNIRGVDIRGRHGDVSPSIETRFTEANTPGLTSQPTFLQFGEGIRFKPSTPKFVKLDYSAMLEEFHSLSNSRFSFRRYTLDFNHNIPLRTKHHFLGGNDVASERGSDDTCFNLPTVKDSNGKRTVTPGSTCSPQDGVPKLESFTTDTVGSVSLRALIVGSIANSGSVVPFYFQPTLGGSNINGEQSLASYPDYRFRAPNLLLMSATFEHSVYWIFGVTSMAAVGKVATNRDDLDLSHLHHTYAAGLTVRAGNIPQIRLLFAWGGNEGTHTTAFINPALIGGNPRPSLY